MTQVSISWSLDKNFVEENLDELVREYQGNETKSRHDYALKTWTIRDLKLILFEEKLTVQGRKTQNSLKMLNRINGVDGLSLEGEDREKYVQLLQKKSSGLLCSKCQETSLLLNAKVENLDIIFEKECGHLSELRPPFLVLTNRILPDLNVLVAKDLSRCLKLNYFENFEIALPNFTLNMIDTLGRSKKKSALNEIEKLREFNGKDKIEILNFEDEFPIPDKSVVNGKEDDIFLKIANFTNSILFTGDETLREKALLDERPTIFLHPDERSDLKAICDTREKN